MASYEPHVRVPGTRPLCGYLFWPDDVHDSRPMLDVTNYPGAGGTRLPRPRWPAPAHHPHLEGTMTERISAQHAASRAAELLDQARDGSLTSEEAHICVVIAQGWTNLYQALTGQQPARGE